MKQYKQNHIDFINNKHVIDQKTWMIDQIYDQFSTNGKRLQNAYSKTFPHSKSAKVSRGENYKGYPYLILDYPRHFESENIFAIRTLFWWGHYFSSTLHLKGSYLKEYAGKLEEILKKAEKSSTKLFTSNNEDEWEHDLFAKNYSDHLNLHHINESNFLKLCIHLPLEEINKLDLFIASSEELFIKTIK